MNLFEEVLSIKQEIQDLRRMIHLYPEPGNKEYRTSSLIENYLKKLDIETVRIGETAIIGTLSGSHAGKTIAFRADMDALPVTEQTRCKFSSKNDGFMHACGHDIHSSALLGLAKLLSLHKDEINGTVKFFFEPDEEGDGGAKPMIESGCMKDVEKVFGAHVDPMLPLGTIGIRYGKFYAAANTFDVTVHGKSAHGATPELGIDSLAAACEMICEIKKLASKFSSEAILSVGKIKGGTARNIISDTTSFSGIIRTLGQDTRAKVISEFNALINSISEKHKTTLTVDLKEGYPGITNTDECTSSVESALTSVPQLKVVRIENPLMTTEDFGYFINVAKGSFYHIGAGCSEPLHSPLFIPDEMAPVYAAAAHFAVAASELNLTCR